jgi:hypothetical protein
VIVQGIHQEKINDRMNTHMVYFCHV